MFNLWLRGSSYLAFREIVIIKNQIFIFGIPKVMYQFLMLPYPETTFKNICDHLESQSDISLYLLNNAFIPWTMSKTL